MIKPVPVSFERALEIAKEKTMGFQEGRYDELILVRDLRGRVRVILPEESETVSNEKKVEVQKFGEELSEALGPYGIPESAVLFAGDLMQGEALLNSTDKILLGGGEAGRKTWLLGRQIFGQDWIRPQLPRQTKNRRVTFFGIKGGVGRSTALTIWAWRLAKQGKKVLVLDLDLESPGVSSTLLPNENLPDYGLVDWFVEDGVGNAGIVKRSMVAPSPLGRDLAGEISVVPAFGRDTGHYLPKLARCYAEFSGTEPMPWIERLQKIVVDVEQSVNPDLVILDSRAGLHDIAAASVVRMDADAFLFAVDSMQTWNAYGFLFKHWQGHQQLIDFRRRLQIVSGMTPETGREMHLKRFTERSWDLFREHLYDEIGTANPDAFSFDLDENEAPHYPLLIFWNRALQEFDPLNDAFGIDEQIAEAAMGGFMAEAERIVFTTEDVND